MAAADDIQDNIESSALKPKKIKTSTAEIEQHSLADKIAAQKHTAAQDAASENEFFGVRVRRARFKKQGSGDCD